MTSCWESVSLINSPSPPQGTSHGSTRPFGLRISKIFEGSVRISLEDESSTLEEEATTLDEDSATLDEETSTLEELLTSLRLELSGVEDELEDSGAGSVEEEDSLDGSSAEVEDDASPQATTKSTIQPNKKS